MSTAQDYRLQLRKCTANHFEDVYVGSETEFIVLHIDPNVNYQFRVCARGDGLQEETPRQVTPHWCLMSGRLALRGTV